MSITRYNKVISGVDFFSLWDCINVCSANADSTGLIFGEILPFLPYTSLENC